MNFYKLYIGDYQRDTAHLSLVEHGAYMLMLQHYYATEKPLPTGKALYRMLRAESKIERDAIDWIVAQFWEVIDGGLMNKRAAIEIAKAARQRTINQELGKRGGRPKKTESVSENETEQETDSVPEREPIDNPNHSHSHNHKKKELKPTPLPRVPADRGTRLAEGWEPSRPCRDWAATQCPDIDFDWALEAFRDYWLAVPGQKGRKLDWERTLKNRLRDLQDRHKLRPQSTYKPADIDAWLAKEDT